MSFVSKSATKPKVFQDWVSEYLHVELSEDNYHKALIAAECLMQDAKICCSEWLDMVRLANAALCKFEEADDKGHYY